MAHPAAIITPAQMDTFSFRRADGSRHEVAYDGYSIPRRPGLPFTTTTTTTNTFTTTTLNTTTVPRYTFIYNPSSRVGLEPDGLDHAAAFGPIPSLGMGAGFEPGSGSGYGSPFGSSYNGGYGLRFTQRHHQEYPRSSVRPFRQDNDEPAEPMMFLRETRQSVCTDGRDRSRCSKCKQAVFSTQQTAVENKGVVSPQRVFRDLVMSDAGEPLRPAVRDALLAAFAHGKSSAPHHHQRERTFHLFPLLPPEVRRMVWEAALPPRVLLRDDLCQITYRSIRKTFRPSTHVYTIEELWQSDLFYVCTEARQVVAAHVRGPGHVLAADQVSTGPAAPMDPLMMNVTTRTKLESGLDVLYYPWHGSKRASDRGGGGPIRQGPPYMALPDAAAVQQQQQQQQLHQQQEQHQHQYQHQHTCALKRLQPAALSRGRAPTIAAEVFSASPQPIPASHRGYSGMGVYCMPGLYGARDQAAVQDEAQARNYTDAERDKRTEACLACNPFPKPPTATTSTRKQQQQHHQQHQQRHHQLLPPRQNKITSGIAPFPINAIPYGHWASQLRILRVPVSAVALDAAWIDKQHPDTLAWAVGVDLSDSLECDPGSPYAQPKPVPPSYLKVVLADITIPVLIELDGCASAAHRLLLQRHVFAHPSMSAGYRMQRARGTAGADADADTDADIDSADDRDTLINLNGKDYSVLVDLYDDRRISELFSLATDTTTASPDSKGKNKQTRVALNKAALHRCIRCTRLAWEARSRASPTAWSGKFGNLVGSHLQKICRPTILFTVVLAFDKVAA